MQRGATLQIKYDVQGSVMVRVFDFQLRAVGFKPQYKNNAMQES